MENLPVVISQSLAPCNNPFTCRMLVCLNGLAKPTYKRTTVVAEERMATFSSPTQIG